MGFFSKIFKTRAEDWFFAYLEPNQTPSNSPREKVNPDQAYLSLHMKSMRIVNVRKGLNTFYGAIHSFVSLPHRGGQPAEFNVLTTPMKLEELDAKNIDRVISLDKRLFGPVPYRGGDMELEAGLFSIKSADLAKPFISLLEDISALSGVSYISQALPFAEPLKKGVNMLTGSEQDTILEIGLSKEFKEQSIETGYFVVMRAPKGQVDAKGLKVDSTDFRLTDVNGKAIKDFPYIVFELSQDRKRSDWFAIPELQKPFQELRKDVVEGNYTSAEESLKVFRRTVLTCNDLLFADAKKLYAQVERETNETLGTGTTSAKEWEFKDLKDYKLYD